jgi:hypothetical protein
MSRNSSRELRPADSLNLFFLFFLVLVTALSTIGLPTRLADRPLCRLVFLQIMIKNRGATAFETDL